MTQKNIENDGKKGSLTTQQPSIIVDGPKKIPDEKPKKFRIRSKTYFLTYPRVPATIGLEGAFKSQLQAAFHDEKYEQMNYFIVRETHVTGDPHIHCYIEFPGIKPVYSREKLHVIIKTDKGPHLCQGNYQAGKNKSAIINYLLKTAKKSADIYTNMRLPITKGMYFDEPVEHLYYVMKTAGLKKAINLLYEEYPKLAINRGTAIRKNLEEASKHFASQEVDNAVQTRDITEFNEIPNKIQDWMTKGKKHKALLLYGPSGVGKTELAKSICKKLGLKYVIIRDVNALSGLSSALYDAAIIFDDLDVENISDPMLIHLYDVENVSQIRVLYGTAEITPLNTRIFTTNFPTDFTRNKKALLRRLELVEVPRNLYVSVKKRTTIVEEEIIVKSTGSNVDLDDYIASGTDKEISRDTTTGQSQRVAIRGASKSTVKSSKKPKSKKSPRVDTKPTKVKKRKKSREKQINPRD